MMKMSATYQVVRSQRMSGAGGRAALEYGFAIKRNGQIMTNAKGNERFFQTVEGASRAIKQAMKADNKE